MFDVLLYLYIRIYINNAHNADMLGVCVCEATTQKSQKWFYYGHLINSCCLCHQSNLYPDLMTFTGLKLNNHENKSDTKMHCCACDCP
jgi:hypothetical protein